MHVETDLDRKFTAVAVWCGQVATDTHETAVDVLRNSAVLLRVGPDGARQQYLEQMTRELRHH